MICYVNWYVINVYPVCKNGRYFFMVYRSQKYSSSGFTLASTMTLKMTNCKNWNLIIPSLPYILKWELHHAQKIIIYITHVKLVECFLYKIMLDMYKYSKYLQTILLLSWFLVIIFKKPIPYLCDSIVGFCKKKWEKKAGIFSWNKCNGPSRFEQRYASSWTVRPMTHLLASVSEVGVKVILLIKIFN